MVYPGDVLPTHPRLQARDVGLRRARGIDERGVARVEVGEIGDLVGAERAADAGMLRPAVHAGLEEGAIDDQLTAALEQVEQARLALGSVERVCLLHRHPRHPPPLGGQRVARAGQLLFLDEHLLVRGLPLLLCRTMWAFIATSCLLPCLVACMTSTCIRPAAAASYSLCRRSQPSQNGARLCAASRGRPGCRDACASRRPTLSMVARSGSRRWITVSSTLSPLRLQLERHVAAAVPGERDLARRIEFGDAALHPVLFGKTFGRACRADRSSSSLRQTNSKGVPTFISISPAASHLRRSSLSVR